MSLPPQPPGQQSPFTGPTGQLVLNLKKPWGSMGMITPQVTIDGYPATAQWGRNEFSTPAGPRRVECSVTYLWKYGRAADIVPVEPNSRVEVFYTPPMLTFLGGRIGPVEQPRRGALVLWLILIVLAVLIVLIIFGIALDG